MSDSPAKTFKDFIGWALVGLAGVVLALVSLIYSSVRADVGNLDAIQRAHAERIKGAERDVDALKDVIKRIDENLQKMDRKLDSLKH